MSEVIPASIDYSIIPPGHEGKWILVRIDPRHFTQEIIASGNTIDEVTGGRSPEEDLLLTRVPHHCTVIVADDQSK